MPLGSAVSILAEGTRIFFLPSERIRQNKGEICGNLDEG